MLALAVASLWSAALPEHAIVHAVRVHGDVAVSIRIDAKRKDASIGIDRGAPNVALDNDTLVIDGVDKQGAALHLVVDALTRIDANDAARIDVAGLDAKALAIVAAGSAHVTLAGRSTSLTVAARGTAHVDAHGIDAQAVHVALKDAARAEVKAVRDLDCDLQRASRLVVSGRPKNVKKNVAGVAKLVIEP